MVGTDLDKFVGYAIDFDCHTKLHRDYKPDKRYIDRIEQLRGSDRLRVQPYLDFLRICIHLSMGPDRFRADHWHHRAARAEAEMRAVYRSGGTV